MFKSIVCCAVFLLTGQNAWASYISGCELAAKVIDLQKKSFFSSRYTLTVEIEPLKAPPSKGACFSQKMLTFDVAPESLTEQMIVKVPYIKRKQVVVVVSSDLWRHSQEQGLYHSELVLKENDLLSLSWRHFDSECIIKNPKDGQDTAAVCYRDQLSITKWTGGKSSFQ